MSQINFLGPTFYFMSKNGKHFTINFLDFTKKQLKPIFHQNTKYLASGAGVGQCPRRQHFALGIPTCWYLKCENLRYPTPNPDAKPKICISPNASLALGLCVGHVHFIFFVLISFALGSADANPVFSGIWA